MELKNNSMSVEWKITGGKLQLKVIRDSDTKQVVRFGDLPFFELHLKDNSCVNSNDFELTQNPRVEIIAGDADALQAARRFNGKKIIADFLNHTNGISLHWEAVLRDQANYVQQFFSFKSVEGNLQMDTLELLMLPASPAIKKYGSVDGSPLVWQNLFFAIEHPMSQVKQSEKIVSVYLPRQGDSDSSQMFTVSSVMGTCPQGQLRRAFLYYVERERAVPYRQFLHYNSWYDLSWVDRKLDGVSCLDRIQTFADSLIVKRGVQMKAFLFDDGWDDNKTLWQFNSGFPDGFSKLKDKAQQYHADLGVWISPWGGYLEDQKQRLAYGRKQQPPFETKANGFSLTGPVYYKRFKQVAEKFVTKYGVSIFKFDGVGAGNGAAGAGIEYQKDIEALLHLVADLRKEKPDLFFSLTVGTWPSVYWLKYGDAIWRAGKDTYMEGEGLNRQKWITYRDAETYKNVVQRAPLYPLNSLMYHGICIAQNGPPAKFELNDKDIADEIWSLFSNGTDLQELYVNPHLLNSNNWDCLASAIQWSKANEKILTDVHWIGGDPAKLEVYGFAAWSPQKAVLSLRNPSSEVKTFTLNSEEAFQLPAAGKKQYSYYDARKKDREKLGEGNSIVITLQPFELKVLDAIPR